MELAIEEVVLFGGDEGEETGSLSNLLERNRRRKKENVSPSRFFPGLEGEGEEEEEEERGGWRNPPAAEVATELRLSGYEGLAWQVRLCGQKSHRTCRKELLCHRCSDIWRNRQVQRALRVYRENPGSWWALRLSAAEDILADAPGKLWRQMASGGGGLLLIFDLTHELELHYHGIFCGERADELLPRWTALTGGDGWMEPLRDGPAAYVSYSADPWKPKHPLSAEARVRLWLRLRGRQRVRRYGCFRAGRKGRKGHPGSCGAILARAA